ncbi:MAG: glycosyltransferase [bacterium]
MKNNHWPKVSIVTPTLNSAQMLEQCLKSIREQEYPREKIEIIIADGGSTDGTLEIAKKFTNKIFTNKLKTGEAGKALGYKKATGDLIALIDSDNILPSKNWLKIMIKPLLANKNLIGSEPWEYTWRAEDGFITRWSALTGVNDPLVLFLGNYDRMNFITQRWTGLQIKTRDKGSYLEVLFTKEGLPTIGANGTILRKKFLDQMKIKDYLFDVDLIAKAVEEKGAVNFAKVKVGIVHLYCGTKISSFVKKQKRRVTDFLFYEQKGSVRAYPWRQKYQKRIPLFVLACVTLVPLIYQSIRGYFRKKDLAGWAFHPLACWITLTIYGAGFMLSLGPLKKIFFKKEMSREKYGQRI